MLKNDVNFLTITNSGLAIFRNIIPSLQGETIVCPETLSSKINISKVIFEKPKKMLKIADFANFGPKYLGPQSFPRHAVCGSKLEIQFSFTYIRVRDIQLCPQSPHKNVLILLIWVTVGDCPSLTFSLLAKVFAKGKMFWYIKNTVKPTFF